MEQRAYVMAGDRATPVSWLGGDLEERARATHLDAPQKAETLLAERLESTNP